MQMHCNSEIFMGFVFWDQASVKVQCLFDVTFWEVLLREEKSQELCIKV